MTAEDDARQESPPGVILVAHEILTTISQEQMLAALPVSFQKLPREVIHLRAVTANLSDLVEFDWTSARRKQAAEANEKLIPVLNAHPGWRLQYFGAAPIPLAMHLGYLVGGWTAIDVYQQRHDNNSWRWPQTSRSSRTDIQSGSRPTERIATDGKVVIRVSVSHRIDPADTADVVPTNLGEIDISLRVPHEDALESAADLQALKDEFDLVIDAVQAARPSSELHVFAAVTVGAAFRLGTAINPTIHSPVHTYQYARASSPRYSHALVLQGDDTRPRALSTKEIEDAAEVRALFGQQMDRIRVAVHTFEERRTSTSSWLGFVLPGITDEVFGPQIREMAMISETELAQSSVDVLTTSVADGFFYDQPSRTWRFDDRFLLAVAEQFATSDERAQAARLLLLHEAVHLKTHGLTDATARQIRRFPKIVEEVDYQADVWAFLHDFAITTAGTATDEEARAFFIRVLSVALDTFWAFDAAADFECIEIRRLNRYLIWYWQLLRIERCSNVTGVLSVLAYRPVIEIAGPKVQSRDNRIFYVLDPLRFDEPEIAVLHKHRIARFGHAPGARVKDVLQGFRERDRSKIREALKSISDQMPD